jgi:hypothetical protein
VVAEEVTPGGDPIFRHEVRAREFELATGDQALIDAIDEHLTRAFPGYDGAVFHEIVSDLVHVDVYLVPATEERPWSTLVTCGMAQRPMSVPEGLEDYRYAELMLALPADWALDADSWEDERWYWPIRLLKMLARLPHEYETFLYSSHTIPNLDPPEPYARGTELCAALISRPELVPEEVESLTVSDGRVVQLWGVFALHRDEMELKLQEGVESLLPRLHAAGITELVDPVRPSVVGRRRRLFGR